MGIDVEDAAQVRLEKRLSPSANRGWALGKMGNFSRKQVFKKIDSQELGNQNGQVNHNFEQNDHFYGQGDQNGVTFAYKLDVYQEAAYPWRSEEQAQESF